MEKLKYMHYARAVEAASKQTREVFSQSVEELERITYQFYIIKKVVKALAYSMRLSGMYNNSNMCIFSNNFYF